MRERKIRLSLQGKMIRNDIFYANEIHRIDKIDGKNILEKIKLLVVTINIGHLADTANFEHVNI